MTTQMPTPTVHNTFAIPRRRELRSGVQTLVFETDSPLVPWHIEGHLDLYASVDQIDEQVARFRSFGPQPAQVEDTGHLVIVSGSRGTGKTSLIHRCVDHLAEMLVPPDGRTGDRAAVRSADPSTGQRTAANGSGNGADTGTGTAPDAPLWATKPPFPNVHIVTVGSIENTDLGISTGDDGNAAELAQINVRIYEKALTHARDNEKFRRVAESFPNLGSPDLYLRREELSRALADVRHYMIIIIPYIKFFKSDLTVQFIRSCRSLGGPGIVVFMESADPGLTESLASLDDGELENVTHLTIGPLRDDDCARFVNRRVMAQHPARRHVTVAPDAVNGHRPRLDYRHVRDLQEIFSGLSDEIIRNDQETIDLEQLRLYQERRRRDSLEGMRRNPLRLRLEDLQRRRRPGTGEKPPQ